MKRVRRLLTSLAGGTVLAACTFPGVLVAAPPANSGPVVRFEDGGNGYFMNAEQTRSAFTGAPAELACYGIQLSTISYQFVETASGAVIAQFSGRDRPIWLYEGSLDVVCAAVFAGGTPASFAEGTVREVYTDNDYFVSGTRVNSFGATVTGVVTDLDGVSWGFVSSGRLQWTLDGEFRIVSDDFRLSPHG
jgi:hypothetical protein